MATSAIRILRRVVRAEVQKTRTSICPDDQLFSVGALTGKPARQIRCCVNVQKCEQGQVG